MSYTYVPCVVVDVDDANARLLSRALHQVHDEDDLGLRTEAIRKILEVIPEEEVLRMPSETASGLRQLEVVRRAFGSVAVDAATTGSDSPNARGTALYTLYRTFPNKERPTDDDR